MGKIVRPTMEDIVQFGDSPTESTGLVDRVGRAILRDGLGHKVRVLSNYGHLFGVDEAYVRMHHEPIPDAEREHLRFSPMAKIGAILAAGMSYLLGGVANADYVDTSGLTTTNVLGKLFEVSFGSPPDYQWAVALNSTNAFFLILITELKSLA
jgi:hypothetical protein